MKNKIKISKKILLQLAIFASIIGVAFVFDFYFDNDTLSVESSSENSNESTSQNAVYFVGQANSISAKLSAPKISGKRFQVKSHDKYLQKYHQKRNYQVLKAEVQTQTAPIILSYHYLVFQNYFYSIPSDEPFIS